MSKGKVFVYWFSVKFTDGCQDKNFCVILEGKRLKSIIISLGTIEKISISKSFT